MAAVIIGRMDQTLLDVPTTVTVTSPRTGWRPSGESAAPRRESRPGSGSATGSATGWAAGSVSGSASGVAAVVGGRSATHAGSRDRLAVATLMGHASRLASRRDRSFDDAAADLRRAAGGRRDLLGEAAGVFAAMGRGDAAAWYANAAAHLCIAADGDPAVARGHVDTVVGWLSGPTRGVAGGPLTGSR